MNARRLISEKTLWQSYKRQSIQEAVIRLMCREGLKSVTMERVAQEVGIAKGTVYLHYHDKKELLDEVKQSALAPLMVALEVILRSDEAPAEKLRTYSHHYFSYFEERRDLFRILIYEREMTQGSRYHSDRYRRLIQEIARVIREGIRSGVFRDADAHKVAAMFLESNFALLNQRLLSEKPAPVEGDANLIADVFLAGLEKRGRK
jgi:TetR/AcrR family transcriptional repressor of multidrug resistance operon